MALPRADPPPYRATRRDRAWRPVIGLVISGWIAALGSAPGCVSGPYAVSERDGVVTLTHRSLGYEVARPAWAEAPGWRPVDLDESDLAYRNDRGAAVSLASSCPTTRATVAMLARHVTIGTPRTGVVAAGPFEQGGAPGWSQTFDTVQDGETIRVKVVTLLAGGCIYDWLLVGHPDTFAAHEAEFDGWVQTFEPPHEEEAS